MSDTLSPSSPHLIAILMSASGRFLVCRKCGLRFVFPEGTLYDRIAKQFQSSLCPSPSVSFKYALFQWRYAFLLKWMQVSTAAGRSLAKVNETFCLIGHSVAGTTVPLPPVAESLLVESMT